MTETNKLENLLAGANGGTIAISRSDAHEWRLLSPSSASVPPRSRAEGATRLRLGAQWSGVTAGGVTAAGTGRAGRSRSSPSALAPMTAASSWPAGDQARADEPYKLLKTVKVGGTGGFDYVFADSDGRRLYIPRSGGEDSRVTGGPGFLSHFAPGERHAVKARSDARLLLVLAPWPGVGHPSRGER